MVYFVLDFPLSTYRLDGIFGPGVSSEYIFDFMFFTPAWSCCILSSYFSRSLTLDFFTKILSSCLWFLFFFYRNKSLRPTHKEDENIISTAKHKVFSLSGNFSLSTTRRKNDYLITKSVSHLYQTSFFLSLFL